MPDATDLERAIRQARTPRVRRAKLLEAERVASEIATVADGPELTDLRVTLAQILAGVLDFPAWRERLLSMARAVIPRSDEDDMIALFMLTS